jgi:hypothetical protein
LVTRQRVATDGEATEGETAEGDTTEGATSDTEPGSEPERRVQRRTVQTSRGYLSAVELPLTFGLGADEEAESLRVTWPDGSVQEVSGGDLHPGQLHGVQDQTVLPAPTGTTPD